MKHIFWTADERSNRRKILAVSTQLKQLRKESLKKKTNKKKKKTKKKNILHGYITNSQYDKLPVGLIAQFLEHCTGIAEVKFVIKCNQEMHEQIWLPC